MHSGSTHVLFSIRADGKHLYRSNGLYPNCAWNQSQVPPLSLPLAAIAANCTSRIICHVLRQVKQLIKMGALAPRYPGVSEADDKFNDECPICFFRCTCGRCRSCTFSCMMQLSCP